MAIEKSKVNRYLGIILLTLICGFVAILLLQISAILLGPSKKACTKKVCLARFLEGPPAFNDEILSGYLRTNFLHESHGPYALSGNGQGQDNFFIALRTIKDYFKDKERGTFVVLGAGDGEYNDLTLHLEQNQKWKGLLVEPHPELYKKLKAKGRWATLSNACVSPFAYPTKVVFAHAKVFPSDSEEQKLRIYRETKLKQLWSQDEALDKFDAQCVPLENLVYAADIKDKIDLLVLDMAGTDLDVLLNVRFDNMPDFDMVIVHSHGSSIGNDIGGYFLEKNIVVKKVIGHDPLNGIFILSKFQPEEEEF